MLWFLYSDNKQTEYVIRMYRRRKVNLLGGLNIYTTLRSIENVYLQFSKTIFSSKKYNTSTFKYLQSFQKQKVYTVYLHLFRIN